MEIFKKSEKVCVMGDYEQYNNKENGANSGLRKMEKADERQKRMKH